MEKIYLSGYIVNTDANDDRRGVYGDKWFDTYAAAEGHALSKAGKDNDSEHTFFVFEAKTRIDVATLPVTVVAL